MQRRSFLRAATGLIAGLFGWRLPSAAPCEHLINYRTHCCCKCGKTAWSIIIGERKKLANLTYTRMPEATDGRS